MWIPTPVYERIPQFWFLLGLLFIANGLYIGLDFAAAFGYGAIGLICCAYGVGIEVMRSRYRSNKSADDDAAESVESAEPAEFSESVEPVESVGAASQEAATPETDSPERAFPEYG